MGAIHEACDKAAAAVGGTVPLEVTKTETVKVDPVAKADAPVTDEKIAEIVASVLAKAMGQEEKKPEVPLTLEEKIAKAVEGAIAPLMKSADPTQKRPRYVEKSDAGDMTEEDRDKLAKSARGGNREAIAKLFANTSKQQAEQMVN